MSFLARKTSAVCVAIMVACILTAFTFAQDQPHDSVEVETPSVTNTSTTTNTNSNTNTDATTNTNAVPKLQEPRFVEIILTDEGVVATDTSYNEWYYDFTNRVWVAGFLPSNPDAAGRDFRNPDQESIEDRCTEVKYVEPYEKMVIVGLDEFVDGDIMASGRVTVKGWVKGDVTSLGNRVLVTEFGRVDGDITAPKIIIKDGAIVGGQIVETDIPDLSDFTEQVNVDGIVAVVVITILLLFFAFLIVTLMPGQVERFNNCINENATKSFLIGFLFVFLMPVVMLLVIITIVGILLIPFVFLAYLFAILLGVVSFGQRIGKKVTGKYMGGQKGNLLNTFVGTFLLMAAWIAVAMFGAHGGEAGKVIAGLLATVTGLFTLYACLSGIGAAILTRFGFKTYIIWHKRSAQAEAPAPAPPPLTNLPPTKPPSDQATESDESNQ